MYEKLKVDFHVSALVNGHRAKEVQERREKELEEISARLRSAK